MRRSEALASDDWRRRLPQDAAPTSRAASISGISTETTDDLGSVQTRRPTAGADGVITRTALLGADLSASRRARRRPVVDMRPTRHSILTMEGLKSYTRYDMDGQNYLVVLDADGQREEDNADGTSGPMVTLYRIGKSSMTGVSTTSRPETDSSTSDDDDDGGESRSKGKDVDRSEAKGKGVDRSEAKGKEAARSSAQQESQRLVGPPTHCLLTQR